MPLLSIIKLIRPPWHEDVKYENEYDKLITTLMNYKIDTITISCNEFTDLSDKDMSIIYQSINRKGNQLTLQEQIAARKHNVKFISSDIEMNSDLKKILQKYYNDRNLKEKLSMDQNFNSNEINIFEILTSLDIIVKNKFQIVTSSDKETLTKMCMPFNVFNIIVGFDSDITTELINNYINFISYMYVY